MTLLSLAGGLVYLLIGGDLLVRGSVALARHAGISELAVGLTIVAFGTSAPELVVSVGAAFSGVPGIALGNVVGSNIANVLLVIGVPALIYPVLSQERGLGRHAVLGVVAGAGFLLLCGLGPLGRVDGLLLLVGLMIFLAVSTRSEVEYGATEADLESAFESVIGLPSTLTRIVIFLGLGLVALPVGANLVVVAGVELARAAQVENAAIGLTLIALGTSLPELGTCVVAALHRNPEVALGNVLGSNLFNLLAIGGITALISPHPIPIPSGFLRFDLWIMLGTALLLAGFINLHRPIGRLAGAGLLLAYVLYIGSVLGH